MRAYLVSFKCSSKEFLDAEIKLEEMKSYSPKELLCFKKAVYSLDR